PIHVCPSAMLHGSLLGNGPRSSIDEAARFSLWHPRLPKVHGCTTGGITTSQKPLAMYGADEQGCGKIGENCQVPTPLGFRHQQLNCRLVSGLEPPRTCRFLRCLRNSRIEEGGMVGNRFTRPTAKNARRRICKVWLGSDLQSAVSARFRQRYKLLNLLQVL